jgi:RecA-family ATPase
MLHSTRRDSHAVGDNVVTLAQRAAQRFDRLIDDHAWPAPIDLEALAEREPAPPAMIIPDWLPAGYATLLGGHGGAGKSTIALTLAVCIGLGLPFFGLAVERRRVLYLSCEDRENVLHWRLSRICSNLGITLDRLRGNLDIVDLVGRDCILWERDPSTGNTVTAASGHLGDLMHGTEREVLFVDGVSDVFAGNENARGDVKRFINSLVALIDPNAGAVVLIAHVNKPAALSGQPSSEGYSGSTGWHNGVRSRWYLFPETVEGEDGGRPRPSGDLILELQKSNLGRADQSIRFSWDATAHLFIGREIVGATASDHAHRDRLEQDGILRALQACAQCDPPIIVPAATTGRRTAHHVLSARRELPDSLRAGKPAVRRFWRQLETLRAMGAVNAAEHRNPDRHYITQLVLTPDGLRACGE